MSNHDAYHALRERTSLADQPQVVPLRIAGAMAFDALDALCPQDLFVRDGQMLHSLLLDDTGQPLSDLYFCRDDEDFILLSEGMSPEQLVAYLRDGFPADCRPDIVPLYQTHQVLTIGGPWSWEVLSEVVGPGVIGLPYLSFYHEADWTCFRAGKTGEFGFDLLIERSKAEAVRARLLAAGEGFELAEIDQEVLDQAALENLFFNIRREGQAGVTPLELQLQWRISPQKDHPGSAALKARLEAGLRERITCLTAPEAVSLGDEVSLDGERVGRVVNAGFSPARGDWVALALLDLECAHAGLWGYRVAAADGGVDAVSVAPPVINNRSLFVQAQQHSFHTLGQHDFPPLASHGEPT